MMKLFERHYQAIVHHGLINENTNIDDFMDKMVEEYQEILDSKDDNELVQ